MDAKLTAYTWLPGILTAALLLSGCGGKPAALLSANSGGAGTAQGPLADPAAQQFPVLPGLPLDAQDLAGPRSVSEKDNIQLGNEDWQHGGPGADYSDTNLVLYGPSGEFGAWGIWQWSGFTGGLVPNSVTVDATLDPGRSYWLLVSNYSTGRWQIVQEVSTKTCTYNFEPGYNYTSPGHSVYVALIADRTNAALIRKLNLRADRDIDPPAPPRNLRAQDVLGHQALILWDKNSDPDVMNYALYSGLDADFEPGDAGVSVVKGDLTFLESQYLSLGLESATTYHYKLTATDVAGNESRPSEVCTFTTLENSAPVVDYSYSPAFVQVDRDVTFDPTATTDAGDDISHDIFQWDFNNDGVVDRQTSGPEIVTHQYSQRRTYICKLTVSDGELEAELSKSIQVSFRYDYHIYGKAGGFAASMNHAITDAASGRIAVGASRTDGFGTYYYHDGSWEWLPIESVPGDYFVAPGLGADTVAVLTLNVNLNADNDPVSIDWYVYEYLGGGTWNQVLTGHSTDTVFASGALACSPAGRYTAALITAPTPPELSPPNFSLHCFHQQAGGGVYSATENFGGGIINPIALKRNDTDSYCVIANSSDNIELLQLDDSSSSLSLGMDTSLGLTDVVMEESTQNPGEICWLAAQTDGSLVWGDNFGADNDLAQQTLSTPEPALFVTGLRSRGDNEAQLYWIGQDNRHVDYLRGYDSTANAGSGESYEFGHGYALAVFGAGGALEDGADSGVYFAVQEERDGELIGYYADGGSLLRQETIYQPSGISPVMGYSWPVVYPDDSLSVLCQQPFPTAIRARTAALDAEFTKDICGDNNYVIPAAACATGSGTEFFVASPSYGGDIVLTRFADSAAVTGEEGLVVNSAVQPVLKLHPVTGKLALVYLKNSSYDICLREWNGSDWDPEQLVFSGAVTIMQLTLAPQSNDYWSIAYAFDNDQVWLTEQDGGGWSTPQLINSSLLNDYCGIGLAYSPDGDCAVAMERGNPQKFYVGERPLGETAFNWSLLDETTDGWVRGTMVFFDQGAKPVVFYYRGKVFEDTNGIYVMEHIDGEWTIAHFDFVYWSTPLGTAVDSHGNIVVSGVYGFPAEAVYTVIWR